MFSLPKPSKPTVTDGFTPVSPGIDIPLKVIVSDEPEYPNPGSPIVSASKAPFKVVAVAVAVIPVNVCDVPEPSPDILSSAPPAVAAKEIVLPDIVLTKYVVPETNPPIDVPPPLLYVTPSAVTHEFF